ncbi:hypothetical protein AMAG_20136 [Allomyces macrogynus ATCC 38327]|uniref:ER membrane protein complex subunit 2 n=1 Tax=Allomyces macrogynus (strain ATCC 38327) TaxID=578462 RepID=A0A0L0T526_ALLM3|nr:hypothetical protein AMAG_20136 [Allomyces macrogynus ATCC 38327]|eukprot:KNE69908.1 hypothetical protein AMAG_20136 [Allomyces macrogynus ATCC 38327]
MQVQSGQPYAADAVLRSAITADLDSTQVWAALRHVAYVNCKWTVAQQAYESLLAYHANYDDALVLRRLAAIYYAMACGGDEWGVDAPCVDVERMAVAQDMFVRARAWTGVGLACMGLGNGEEAEASLGAAFHAHCRAQPAAECTQRALEQDPADTRTRALLTDILAAVSIAPTPVPGTAVSVSRLG